MEPIWCCQFDIKRPTSHGTGQRTAIFCAQALLELRHFMVQADLHVWKCSNFNPRFALLAASCSLQVSGADYDEASCVINKHNSFLVWVSVCDVLLRLPSGLSACLLPASCWLTPFVIHAEKSCCQASSTLPVTRGLLYVWVILAATCTTHMCLSCFLSAFVIFCVLCGFFMWLNLRQLRNSSNSCGF